MEAQDLKFAGHLGVFPKAEIWITSATYLRPLAPARYYRVSFPAVIIECKTIEEARKEAYEIAAMLNINVTYPTSLMVIEDK